MPRANHAAAQVAIHRITEHGGDERLDDVAIEEPLEIRIAQGVIGARREEPISVTMRTPGHDDELAAGFLFGEGILRCAADIRQIDVVGIEWLPGETANAVDVELTDTARVDLGRLQRHFYATSSCGVCGKASIAAICAHRPAWPNSSFHIETSAILAMPARLREAQAAFDLTGALHAAALFDADGRIGTVREDVGRHNAVDKVVGAELLAERIPLLRSGLLLSGRAGFELVQKAGMAGIPLVAAVGAPTSLAIDLALRFEITLIGFLRDGRFNVYCDPAQRLIQACV